MRRRSRRNTTSLNWRPESPQGKTARSKHRLNYSKSVQHKLREEVKNAGYQPQDLSGYENHYNLKMNKCFVIIQSSKIDASGIFVYKTLSDAFEGKSYAEYAWLNNKGKKYWEVKPFVCTVKLPSGNEKNCNSSDEFEELIKVYMSE